MTSSFERQAGIGFRPDSASLPNSQQNDSGLPANALFSTPLITKSGIVEEEEDDEWEYEYSATETETYYVTLDLTFPAKAHHNRGFKARPPKKKRKSANKAAEQENNDENDEDGEGDDDDEKEDDRAEKEPSPSPEPATPQPGKAGDGADDSDEDGNILEKFMRDPKIARDADGREIRVMWTNPGIGHGPGQGLGKPKRKRGGGFHAPEKYEKDDDDQPVAPVARPTTLQIAKLHTPNPVVSYGGSLYRCNWVKNIGTEFLFTERETEDPLPAVYKLPDDVDLLAASSTRIMSQYVGPAPLPDSEKVGFQIDPATERIIIPRNYLHSAARKKAAPFLEQLANIKRERGETDQVTLISKPSDSLKDATWIGQLKRKREEEKQRLEQQIANELSGPELEVAKARLYEITTDIKTPPPDNAKPVAKAKGTVKRKQPIKPRARRKASVLVEDSDEESEASFEDDEEAENDDAPWENDEDDIVYAREVPL
ncbi:hypothetical protein B0O99DRAFT_744650 [Bisporella sp. PMI_857]|nr:hypothetical protein B0O99DRAFT_744650 [Bisporella sp. PMI_857]